MENFMNYDFNINKIVLATYVNPGSGNAVHQNRPSHGLANISAEEKIMFFQTVRTSSWNRMILSIFPKNHITVLHPK